MKLYTLSGGEEIHRYQKSIVIAFRGRKKVVSTSPYHGGVREDITAVFNHDCTVGAGISPRLKAPTYAEHLALIAEELGLDPKTSTGLSTAAQMENVSICTESYGDIVVTAAVTGGVEINGGRAGDPASWDELAGRSLVPSFYEVDESRLSKIIPRVVGNPCETEDFCGSETHSDSPVRKNVEPPFPTGTINIMLFMNVNLPDGVLVRSLMTATEAKSAALQELMASSRYSNGIATGSGTDGLIAVCDRESPLLLENTGKHCKLGELIGVTVKTAVKDALRKQSALTPLNQRTLFRRTERYRITPKTIWRKCFGDTNDTTDSIPDTASSDSVLNPKQNPILDPVSDTFSGLVADSGVVANVCSGVSSETITKAKFWEVLERLSVQEELVCEVSLYLHLVDQLTWGLFSPKLALAVGEGQLQRLKRKFFGDVKFDPSFDSPFDPPKKQDDCTTDSDSEDEVQSAAEHMVRHLEDILAQLVLVQVVNND